MQTSKLSHSHTVIEWAQRLLFPTIVIRLIEMAVIVIKALGHVQQMLVESLSLPSCVCSRFD